MGYGSENEHLVAISMFSNPTRCSEKRAEYLDTIQRGKEVGVLWADKAIQKSRQGVDIETEKKRMRTKQWTQKWKRFVSTKERDGNGDRVQWNKYEYRFFMEPCDGRSLVTGQQLADKEADVDRVFNDDGYSISNCTLIDVGLNFAKPGMAEFATYRDFRGLVNSHME